MLAKKCDKCGKLYENYEGIEGYGSLSDANSMAFVLTNNEGEYFCNNAKYPAYDLCPECLVKVQAFIEGKEVTKYE